MEYKAPVDAGDPNDPYITGSAVPPVDGSSPPGEAIEHPMREIVAAITAAGLTPDAAVLDQLLQSFPCDISFMAAWGSDGAGEDAVVQTYGAMVTARPIRIRGEQLLSITGPTGAALICDIEHNGVSIYLTPPRIADGATVGTPGVLVAPTSHHNLDAGDRLEFKITQVGSTVAGQKIMFTVKAGGR